MSWNVFERSLAIAQEYKIPTLNFFGGEPLLNPKILPMLQMTLESGLSLMIATNCSLLARETFYAEFLKITQKYKQRIAIFTATDKFHLKFFDPIKVVERLLSESYNIVVQDYSNNSIALTEYNASNRELQKLNTHGSCCEFVWTDNLGVLPDGGWTICPPSLEIFGNIFINGMKEIVEFKRGLPLRYKDGCTECLKDFKGFHRRFDEDNLKEKSG